MIYNLPKTIIITGHYGTGKTNLAINLAIQLKSIGKEVCIVDLDLINPYFKTSDFASVLQEHEIELVAPIYSGTNLEATTLTMELATQLKTDKHIIIDCAGDDIGATALGMYYKQILARGEYAMLYVVNAYRYLSQTPEQTHQILIDIEKTCGLKATYVVNNSNVANSTTQEMINHSQSYINQTLALCNVPLFATTVHNKLDMKQYCVMNLLPIHIYVKTLWDA